jgi:putative glutamine amidotransferase
MIAMSRRPLRIGLSARIYHPQPGATGLQSKSLQYLEQSVAHWVMSREVMVFMIPSVSGDGIVHRSSIRLSDYPQYLDGLVLQGGADISPQCYGEEPLHPDWAGDRLRDAYEMELFHEFVEAGKASARNMPRRAVDQCRARRHAVPGHRHPGDAGRRARTCRLRPPLPRHRLGRRFRSRTPVPEVTRGGIVSIHHQAIRALGRGLRVEARRC